MSQFPQHQGAAGNEEVTAGYNIPADAAAACVVGKRLEVCFYLVQVVLDV